MLLENQIKNPRYALKDQRLNHCLGATGKPGRIHGIQEIQLELLLPRLHTDA